MSEDNTFIKGATVVAAILVAMGLLAAVCMFVMPQYNVWQQEKEGQAAFAKAESTRKITVLEAQAHMDSAKLLADAEVIRAEGVAKANKIIGGSLEGNEAYLRYLWIQALENKQNEVIYVPTEANIPIMEAGKRK